MASGGIENCGVDLAVCGHLFQHWDRVADVEGGAADYEEVQRWEPVGVGYQFGKLVLGQRAVAPPEPAISRRVDLGLSSSVSWKAFSSKAASSSSFVPSMVTMFGERIE